MSSPPPPGIYVPVPTFFLSAPTPTSPLPGLDLETQLAHALYLARAGITGLILLGSSGEAISLTSSERTSLIGYIRRGLADAGFPGYPLVAGTTAQGIEDVLAQLDGAKQAGADWGMVLAPGFFAAGPGVTQDGVKCWFESVADKAAMPVMIYHYPGVCNNISITPETISSLATHPNIVGCKLSHGNLSITAQIASNPATDHSRFATFTGFGQQLLPVLTVGGAGAIDGLAGIFPRIVGRLYELYRSGAAGSVDLKGQSQEQAQSHDPRAEMQQLQYQIALGYKIIEKYGVPGIKAAVRLVLGFGHESNVRWPLVGDEKAAVEFEGLLRRLKSVEEAIGRGEKAVAMR